MMANLLDQIEKEIRRLTKERDALNRRIGKLQAVCAEYAEDEYRDTARPVSRAGSQGRASKIIAILKEAGRPMHYREIIERLEQTGGERFEGVKDRGATITATLSLNRDVFKRVGKGTYALCDEEGKSPESKDSESA
jgi:hypothetical protein